MVSETAAALDEAAGVLGGRARRQVPIGPLTTYRVGGRAALFLEASDEADLWLARDAVRSSGVPTLLVGHGSNLLVADSGFPGLAVRLGPAVGRVDWHDRPRPWAWAATSLPMLARQCAAAGLTGFEWAVGVPGSIGGAVRMNAGGHGSDMAAVVGRYRVIDLAGPDEVSGTFGPERLGYGYRRSTVSPCQVVVAARLDLAEGDAERSKAAIADIVRWRRDHQPGGQNAGSVFTNPVDDSAGRLIEAAGAKGLRVGSAQVSTKHANFIQADVGGSANDIVALIHAVMRLVAEHSGVDLATELRLVGFGEEQP